MGIDVNTLAGLRIEDAGTFEAIHRLVKQLIAEGRLQGLRLDHIDGLRDPAQYFQRLRRLIRDAQGELWVVDWKTSRHEGKDLEAFLANEQARYAPQLERYAAALEARRLGLYFPALTSWREWKK